jgi:hypothetical protein
MTKYRMSDGMIVDTDKASKSWEEDTRFDGHNQISIPTGSQWEHQTLYRSRRGRYYIEHTSRWRGPLPLAEWISNESATTWLLLNEHSLPDDLQSLEDQLTD